jgi:hypothetical protein
VTTRGSTPLEIVPCDIRSKGQLTLSPMLLSRTATNIVTDTRSVRAGSVQPEPKSEMSSSFSNRCPLLGIVSDLAYLASSRSARSLSRSSPQNDDISPASCMQMSLLSRSLWSFDCGCCGDDGKGKSMFALSIIDVSEFVLLNGDGIYFCTLH